MRMPINGDLRAICREIVAEGKSESEWSEIESTDMFQTPSVHGGFEALELAFCFSLYTEENQEYWFDLTLDQVEAVVRRDLDEIEVRLPKS